MNRLLFELAMYVVNHFINHIPFYVVRNFLYHHLYKLKIGDDTAVQMGVRLLTRGGIEIGHNSVINPNCTLDGRGGLRIGNNVNISSEVMILTAEHVVSDPLFSGTEAPVCISDYVWVSTRAVILPGVTVGKGSVVAAGAVVTKDVPEYSIVGGVPAKVIGHRSTDLQYNLNYFRLFQ